MSRGVVGPLLSPPSPAQRSSRSTEKGQIEQARAEEKNKGERHITTVVLFSPRISVLKPACILAKFKPFHASTGKRGAFEIQMAGAELGGKTDLEADH